MNLTSLNQSLELIIYQTRANLNILGLIAALLFLVYLLVLLSNRRLLVLGIFPRRLYGLPGIFFAPFLHADFNHLFFNCIPLLVLGNFLLIQGLPFFLALTFWLSLLSGLAVWCFGKKGLHVGASALVTGYWGFLVSNSFQHAGLTNLILGLISLYYFAGIFLGIFPGKKGVSWEGHLSGLLAGFILSYPAVLTWLNGFLPLQ